MEKINYDFKNRTAIVTGGAQGFGFDISKRLLESGASVIIWDNDPNATEKAIKDLNNPNLSSHVVDVSNYCLLYTSPSPRDRQKSRMPSSA